MASIPLKPSKEEAKLYPENGTHPACSDNAGILPACAPLAVPFVPFQQTGPKRYSQMDALNNGTLYPGLNLPFRAKVNAANLKQTPMTELQALEFVLQELALYLDTHPSDGEAFELFRQYAAMEAAARADFVAEMGPVMRNETAQSKTYTWLQDPWPWNYMEEGGE